MAKKKSEVKKGGITRRCFLKSAAFLGGSAALSPVLERALRLTREAQAGELSAGYELSDIRNCIRTVCLQCNTGCGIKAKLLDGVVAKIDGNPYSPWNMAPQLPYETPVAATGAVDGMLCAKGQAGLQSAYDPYRIVKVLKRAGKRGENKWETIDFHKAVKEIVNGGKLFKHVPGEESRVVEGLQDLYALKDGGVAKSMADAAKKVAKKQMSMTEFKAKFPDYMDTLIDPAKPDLGPKNNQFAFVWGRLKGGRSEIIKRFTADAFGSVNAHGHTTVCQGSLYFTGKAMSEQYDYDATAKEVKFTGGQKFFWEVDDVNCEFAIYIGVSPMEGNYLTYRAPRISEAAASGRLKYVVADPRFSNLAAKAWKWLPNKPGTEGAFALAIIRWVIENGRYDAKFLANANKAAALADKESSWTNACALVKIDKDGHPGAFLRASEAGLPKETRKAADGTEYAFDPLVVFNGGPVAFDPKDEKKAVEGVLFYSGEVNGHKVKTALQLLMESANEKTMAEWSEICGVSVADLEDVAREFTSHGKKAAIDLHRGVSQHTNGYYNCHACFSLNLLVGNFDWKGGMIKAATYDYSGDKADGPFNLKKLHSLKTSPFGVDVIRANSKYEDSTLFSGYPAKRPWFPLASDIYQEIVPSIGDQYPYPVKAMILYMGTPAYSLPAGHTNIPVLADVEKLPLLVTSDILVGESSMYADYIFPDLTYLERWEFHGSHPTIAQKVQPVRQPAIAPLVEIVTLRGREMPICLESLLIALALELGVSGFGRDGLRDGMDLFHPDDFYLRLVANLAYGEKKDGSGAVPDASAEEMEIFLAARRHLPKSVFDARRWKGIVGAELWPKVVYVLNRGGRFEDYAKSYSGDKVTNKYGKQVNLYCEKTGKTKDSMTGKHFHGIATYVPPALDCLGRPLPDDAYPLKLITYREAFHTKSRTVSNYWLLALQEENGFLVNAADAAAAGLKNGDSVKVISASNPRGVWDLGNGREKPMIGKVVVTEGIRPGVTAFSLGMGHWAYGATDVVVDGKTIKGDGRRGKGVHANAAIRVDPHLGNVSLSDMVGASAVFYDTRVRLEKVA